MTLPLRRVSKLALAFVHFYAMWYLAGVLTRLIASHYPDSFIGQALIYAQ